VFKKNKDEWHDGERYPGGRNPLLSGTSSPPLKKVTQSTRKKKIVRPARLPVNFRQFNGRLDRHRVEKLFMVIMFSVIEIMIYRVFFGVFDSVFEKSGYPEPVRGVLKLAQLAMFIIFTYANIMLSFFKVNIFQ